MEWSRGMLNLRAPLSDSTAPLLRLFGRVLSAWPIFWLGLLVFGSFNSLAGNDQPVGGGDKQDRAALAVEALSRLRGTDLDQNPKLREAVLKVLGQTRGTASFVKLVQHFQLKDQDAGLLEVAARNSNNDVGVEA